jgi:excisionase family DNA binding protein
MNEIKLLTIEEIAKILRVHTRTVTRYIESGRLKHQAWRLAYQAIDLNAF